MIYDCFTFFDELDLLEIRLNELSSIVDHFVLIESPYSHSGLPKPLYFDQNRSRFKNFLPKIIHVVPDLHCEDSASREREQRLALQTALSKCEDSDLIIFSDADEIVSAAALDSFCKGDAKTPAQVQQRFSYYFVNSRGGWWNGSRFIRYGQFREKPDPTHWRYLPEEYEQTVTEGGWHFSYLGGVAGIQAKLKNFSHNDLDRHPYNDPGFIRTMIAIGGDLYLRSDDCFISNPLDETYPHFLLDNRERFSHLIHHGDFHENWYPVSQIYRLMMTLAKVTGRTDWCEDARQLSGAIIELGSWEGRSTIAMANVATNDEILAVDTWQGNVDEHQDHATVSLAQSRDVHNSFLRNIEHFTEGNVTAITQDVHQFAADFSEPVRFAHIDASHDYVSVKRSLESLKPQMVPGGILCGDDFLTADMSRVDLDGGVERAVREFLPGFETEGNFWWWEAPHD